MVVVLASEISTDTFPRSYFVEARGSKSGGEKGKSGGTDASFLDAMKIENSCKISDIKEFCTIELHSTKYSANRMEYMDELNDKLSEMFTISGGLDRDNSTSLGMQEDIDVANALVQDGKCYLHFPTFIAAQQAYNALTLLSNSNEGVFEQPMRVRVVFEQKKVEFLIQIQMRIVETGRTQVDFVKSRKTRIQYFWRTCLT